MLTVGTIFLRDGAPRATEPIRAPPKTSGLDRSAGRRQAGPSLEAIDELVATALQDHRLPGCVVVIGQGDRILFHKAFGARALEPNREEMTEDTLFDLASLTKPIATATSIMILAEKHLLAIDDPVVRYIPEFGKHGKGGITLRDLLTHVSGLPADSALEDFEHGRAEAIRRIADLTPRAPPGVKLIYSDLGFLVLEEVIRRVAHQELDTFSQSSIFAPLGMLETQFRPSAEQKERAAPTEQRQGEWIRGEVHDPRAYRLGGVAGHAGLFSTAGDLVRYARMMLLHGKLGDVRILSADSVRQMMAPHDVPNGIRALGWDMQSSYSANRGESLSRRAVGHGGYTGTALWIDSEKDLFVLFLSNRVHPDGKGSINALAGQIGTLAGEFVSSSARLAAPSEDAAPGSPPPALVLGVDTLRDEHFALLRGAHIGLLTNDSARAGNGERTVDVVAGEKGLTLVALFTPEHGISAHRDERIADGTETALHVPIYSLYGKVLAPTPAMLAGIDTFVVDLPDVGARFYTYASTLHAAMKVARESGIRVVVLDRPDPLDGVDVTGPVLRDVERSFVNHFPLPVRHGMTMGELAEMINASEHLGVDLAIVRLSGWNRGDYAHAWVPPSPNLRTLDQAILYPGVALLEGTNVSVGRGTDTPFELVGAPFIQGETFAHALDLGAFIGVSLEPVTFTPSSSTHAGALCQGIRLHLTDRTRFDPVRAGVALATKLAELYPHQWDTTRLGEMMGNRAVTTAILDHRPVDEIEALWQDDLAAFRAKRAKYLLYPPPALPSTLDPSQDLTAH